MKSQRAIGIVRAHILQKSSVLLAHRRGDDRVWATFGGRREDGETIEQALRREILEELGIAIEHFERLPDRHATPGGDQATIAVFVITAWQGEPSNAAPHEHSEIAWFTAEELKRIPMHGESRAEALRLVGDG